MLKLMNTKRRIALICFFDGLNLEFGIVCYVRWGKHDGLFRTNIVAAKCKVVTLFCTNIPRLELNGLTMMTRVVTKVIIEP